MQLPSRLDTLYAPIRAELGEADAILRDVLQSDHPFVDSLVRHGFKLGGKRLRPALLLLSAKACGRLTEDHIRLAAAVEIIHTATLVHDDVLDDATTRRHIETINARWSNDASILVGDFLFAQSLCMAGSVNDGFAIREIAEACRRMCEGELRQVAQRGNLDLTESEYRDIIEAKTAALLRSCCRLGAHFAGARPDQVESLAAFGLELGMAFQIVDDLLDLVGDETVVGKSLGSDLAKQKLTLPLIRMLHNGGGEAARLREILREAGDAPEKAPAAGACAALAPRLRESDAVDYAQAAAQEHVRRALDAIDRRISASEARDSLESLANFVLDRKL